MATDHPEDVQPDASSEGCVLMPVYRYTLSEYRELVDRLTNQLDAMKDDIDACIEDGIARGPFDDVLPRFLHIQWIGLELKNKITPARDRTR